VVARAFERGCRVEVLGERWDAARFASWIERGEVTHTSLVPTQVHDLIIAGSRAPAGLRAVVVGGGVLDEGAGTRARALGWPVLASYGMTEAGSQVATQSPELLGESYHPTPLPVLPHWEVRVDPGSGRIGLKGASLFAGVLEGKGGRWEFREREEDWFATSDIGRIHPRGLEVLGRADAVVKVLGELVDPDAVAARLGTPHMAVVARPDPRRGHRLVAVFEPPLNRDAAARRVAEHNRNCEGFLRIEELVAVPAIPRSPLGKVRRAELTRQLGPTGN